MKLDEEVAEIEEGIQNYDSDDQLIPLEHEDQLPLVYNEKVEIDHYENLKLVDQFWSVRWIFMFLGITVMLPLKFLLNADQYWMYKLRDIHTSTQSSIGATPHVRTYFQAYFTSYLNIAAIVPSTISLFLSLYLVKWISAQTRMIYSLLFTLLFFVVQTILFDLNTDEWQNGFFTLTMASVFLMNAARVLFQCALLGATSKFPPMYTTATTSGKALGGVFAALANIINIYADIDSTKSAFFYFLFGSACILVSLLLVAFVLPNLPYYNFYMDISNHTETPVKLKYEIENETSKWAVFQKVWIPTVSFSITWIVTLIAYPTLLVIMVVVYPENSIWKEKYFNPVMVFFVYAIADYIGRLISGLLRWPGPKSKEWILILSILRFIMIPVVMTCNLQPRRYLPVYFDSILQFGIINSIFGFTNGYLINIIFMVSPQLVTPKEKETANGIVILGLGGGLTIGVLCSYLALKIL